MTDVSEAMPDAAASPQPGWYQDPRAADSMRWWDGTAWTGHVRPKPGVAPAAPPAQVTTQQPPAIPIPPWAVPTVAASPAGSSASPAIPTSGTAPSGPAHGEVVAGQWGSPLTPSVWAIAAIPLASSILGFLAGLTRQANVTTPLTGVIGLLGLLVSILLAIRDRRQLRARGWTETTHPAWILLVTPIVYLAIRTRRVARAGGRAARPLVLAAVSVGASLFLGLLAVVLAIAVAASGATSGAGGNYGAYDRTGVPTHGRVPDRVDVSQYIATREGLRFGRMVNVDCGFGPLIAPVILRCAVSPASVSAVPRQTAAVTIGADSAVRYTIGPLEPTTSPRLRPSLDGAGPGNVPMERIVVTVAAEDISADGSTRPGADVTQSQLVRYSTVNLHAAGLEWTPGDGCESEETVQPGAALTSGCGFVDATGEYWEVDFDIDDDGIVHLFAEAD